MARLGPVARDGRLGLCGWLAVSRGGGGLPEFTESGAPRLGFAWGKAEKRERSMMKLMRSSGW
jgi:hypothetical protein